MSSQEEVVVYVGGNKIKLDENMSRKIRKFAKTLEKPKSILEKLKSIGTRLINWGKIRKIKRTVTTMQEFEDAIKLLKDSKINDEDKIQIVQNLREVIERTAESYDELLSADDLTDEQRKTLLEEKERRIKELNDKLDEALGLEPIKASIDEPINIPTIEEPITVSPEEPVEAVVDEPINIPTIEEPSVVSPEEPKSDEKEEVRIISPSIVIPSKQSDIADPEQEIEQDNPEDEIEPKTEEKIENSVDYSKLTIEELEAKLAEINDELIYRMHQENGMVEHDDDIIAEKEKIEAEIASRNSEKLEPETMDLSDLRKFDSYDEYLMAYCKAKRKPEDVAKFFIDLRNGIKPQDLLAEEEFVDERRKQIEKIRHDEEQEEIRSQKKYLSEMKVKLSSAEEKIKSLERQRDEDETRLDEAREEIITLRKSITDLEAEVANKEAQNAALNTKARSNAANLTKAQDKIYRQERTISEQVEEIKQCRTQITSLEKEIDNQRRITESKEEELAKSQEKLASLMTNVTSQIKAAKDDAEDDIERAAFRNLEEQANAEEEKTADEKSGPKHLKEENATDEKSSPKHLKEEPSDAKHLRKEPSKPKFIEPTIIGEQPAIEIKPIIIPEKEPELEIKHEADIPKTELEIDKNKPEQEENEELKKAQMIRDVLAAHVINENPELAKKEGIKR